jgi:hypothetical protein
MTPFILDEAGRTALKQIVEYGRKHPYREGTMKAIVEGRYAPAGDNEKRSCVLPINFKIVYSLEEHPGGNWCHHLSVSGGAKGKVPSLPMVEMVMAEIGFKGNVTKQYNVWLEDIDDGEKAVNILGPAEAP